MERDPRILYYLLGVRHVAGDRRGEPNQRRMQSPHQQFVGSRLAGAKSAEKPWIIQVHSPFGDAVWCRGRFRDFGHMHDVRFLLAVTDRQAAVRTVGRPKDAVAAKSMKMLFRYEFDSRLPRAGSPPKDKADTRLVAELTPQLPIHEPPGGACHVGALLDAGAAAD